MSKFTINTDTHSIIEDMSDSEVGKLFKAIYRHQIDGLETPSPDIKIAFKVFIMSIEKEREISRVRAKAGQSKPKQSIANLSKPEQNVTKLNENQSVTIQNRKEKFKSSLSPYIDKYGRDMLNAFFKYWTEPNPSNTKMRFELEKTWSVKLRLSNWAGNNKDIIPTSTEVKINKI